MLILKGTGIEIFTVLSWEIVPELIFYFMRLISPTYGYISIMF